MRRPGAGAIGLAVLAVSAPGFSAGEPGEPIVLQWAAPPGCPSERDVHAEIERVLGGPPDPASRRYLRAEARVSRAGSDTFHVHLVTDLGGVLGERDLDGRTCAAVANAAALIVALTFDPEALAHRAEAAEAAAAPAPSSPRDPPAGAVPVPTAPPSPAEDRSPPPTTATPTRPAAAPSPPPAGAERAPQPRPRFAAGAIGAVSIGALPRVGVGVGGRAGVLVGRFRADVSASYWPSQTATLANRPTAGGAFRLIAGDASACYAVLRAPLELSPCAGLELGSMAATGFGVRSDGSGSALWIAPVAEAAATLPVGQHFAARLDLGVLFPVERPPFVLSAAGTVYTAGAVVGRATLGLELRF
jgi:hypothetical protein